MFCIVKARVVTFFTKKKSIFKTDLNQSLSDMPFYISTGCDFSVTKNTFQYLIHSINPSFY